jgi:hypothetical protein
MGREYELLPSAPDAVGAEGSDAARRSPARARGFFGNLLDIFGWRFLLIISIMYLGIKGLLLSSLQVKLRHMSFSIIARLIISCPH